MGLDAALQEFYTREGLPQHGGMVGAIDWVKVFGISVPIPNPQARKNVLVHHDVHHLVTGYRTDEVGEAEVGAWAIGAGGGGCLALTYDLMAFALGMVRAPKRVLAAYFWGRDCRTLYRMSREELLAMEVPELKRLACTERRPSGGPAVLAGDILGLVGVLGTFAVLPVLAPVLLGIGIARG